MIKFLIVFTKYYAIILKYNFLVWDYSTFFSKTTNLNNIWFLNERKMIKIKNINDLNREIWFNKFLIEELTLEFQTNVL